MSLFRLDGIHGSLQIGRRQHLITFMPKNCMIRRIFDIVGAEKMFPIFETEVEALNAASTIVRNGDRRQIASK